MIIVRFPGNLGEPDLWIPRLVDLCIPCCPPQRPDFWFFRKKLHDLLMDFNDPRDRSTESEKHTIRFAESQDRAASADRIQVRSKKAAQVEKKARRLAYTTAVSLAGNCYPLPVTKKSWPAPRGTSISFSSSSASRRPRRSS